jgi:hypothetical protein
MKISWTEVERIIRDHPERAGAKQTCPKPEDLALLVEEEIGRRARKRIMKHVANCHDCSMILKSLLSLSRTVDELVPKTEADRRLLPASMPDGEKPAGIMRSRRLAITAIASIAGIAIIAVTIARFSRPYALRGGTGRIELIAPEKGALLEAGRIRFEWKAVPGASRYYVEVFGGSLELIWRSEPLVGSPAELPAEAAATVRRGGKYFWKVTAVLTNGQEAVSKTAKFSIRR